ncbi:uncharacterized protein [Sinocyclocheilus grahami]|uniref:uncharacterized protein n=1 Tax=Sinocyclocheilus grahami TaxID=75366 RepID=UPI0007AC52DB|nr:PREDICTED: uncharacterized protein LOC107558468 [Sinocyclocheilus grahami]
MERRTQKSFCGVESVLEEVMRSSDEEQQKDLDRDSTVSSVDSAQEMFIHGLDPVLDRPSTDTDEDWNPESSPERQKRPRQSYSSSSSSSSSASESPSESAAATRGSGKGRGRRSQSVAAVSPSTSQKRWHNVDEDDIGPPKPVFRPAHELGPQLVTTASYTALQLFQLFFSSSVLQTIIQHTNAYGSKNQQGRDKPWHNISVEVMKTCCIMSCGKFLNITNALHLSDPQYDEENEKRGTAAYDRLGKINPLYDNTRDACRTFFHPNQNISIDERTHSAKEGEEQ